MPAPSGSTATTSSTPRCPSAATSSPGGAAKWATRSSMRTPKSSPCVSGCDSPWSRLTVRTHRSHATDRTPVQQFPARRFPMKAAVVHDFTKALSLEDVPKPEPGPGEVLVKVETAGLCHTDIHAAHGDWPVKPTPPFIPGHEGVGIVEQVGPGVTTPQVGDRVAMPWLGEACGVCEYCIDGWETLCEKQVNTGYGIDGSYAAYATPNAAYIAQVPDAVDQNGRAHV